MASELRLTTVDRTLNVSVDPSESLYALLFDFLDPDVRTFINRGRACKVVLNVVGGEVSWAVSRTDTLSGITKRLKPPVVEAINPPRTR